MDKILHGHLLDSLKEVNASTVARDLYEIEYELEKARLMFSGAVNECRNLAEKEAKITLLLNEKGMYRKFAELKSNARIAYYTWSTFKALVENE